MRLMVVAILLVLGCKSPAPVSNAAAVPVENKDNIFFYVLSINKTSENQVQLVSQKVSKGVLKKQRLHTHTQGNALVAYLRFNGTDCDSVVIAHPLSFSVEYEGEQHQLARKQVELDSARFFIRAQPPVIPDAIRFVEVREGKRVKLNEIQLSP